MHRHLVYGLAVESAFPLTSLDEVPDAAAPTAIRLVLESPDFFRRRTIGIALDPDDWIQHAVLPDGAVYMKLRGIFETVVAVDGASVMCARQGDVDERSFEANLLNFVMSAALTLRGEEPLHATVLDFEGRVFGLLGSSGAGKSTLAAALVGRGADLITDDMLRLDFVDGQALAHYGPHRLKLLDEPARRLLPEAMAAGHFNALNGKIMVQPPALAVRRRSPRPIDALFWLGDAPPTSGDVTIKRLAGIELARAITASAMNIRYFAPDRLTRQFRFAERVARTVPVHALAYPRRYELLDRVIAEIRRAAAG
ncbi:hypothetical protein BH11PSE3_BH11PSE3_08070 [soil metagenome]